MRASKYEEGKGQRARGRKSESDEIHISGAEGLYERSEIEKIIKGYFQRAVSHPRGLPDEIVVTLERVKQKPRAVPLLPASTLRCDSPDKARKLIYSLLTDHGISKKAARSGVRVVTCERTMRGASLMLSRSGSRVEPDRERGVRVSRLGIERETEKKLSRRFSMMGVNTPTVKEAMVLASKVASCEGVIAELCVSDDPDYTTGYVASSNLGYVRIPNIKERGSLYGGRVFFIEEEADREAIIEYFEKRPVIISTSRDKPSS